MRRRNRLMRRLASSGLVGLAALVASLAATTADAGAPKPATNTSPPSVSGTPVAGATLTAATGSWLGDKLTFTYQWLRCDAAGAACSRLVNETAQTHVATAGDVGSTLRVTVTGKTASSRVDATSAQTAVVAAALPVPAP